MLCITLALCTLVLGGQMIDEIYNKLAEAIRNKNQVTFEYLDLKREVCPHTLGKKNGKNHVLAYQFAGESSRGLPEGGEWRCFDIDKITALQIREGEWFTGDSHKRPQTCIDHIEVEVEY